MGKIYVRLIVFILLLSIFFYYPQDGTAQGGPTYIYTTELSSNTIWNISGSPYIIMDNLTVPVGIWLWILPGVEVRFNRDVRLWVYGTLYAIGNESDPIIFTSNKTDPGPGNWASIRIEEEANSSVSEIRFARIEYNVIGINAEGSSPIITNNRIENILSKGISLEDSEAYVAHNVIMNSSNKGIDAEDSSPVIENNTISNCSYFGMKFYQSSPILRNNTISNGLTGIELKNSVACIETNQISETKYGIELDNSHDCIIENVTLLNNDYGFYSMNSMRTLVTDSSLSQNKNGYYGMNSSFFIYRGSVLQSGESDFWLKKNSTARVVDSNFDSASLNIQDQSFIEVLNYLIVQVENESGTPYNGSEVTIQDNSELVAILSTNENGTTEPVLLMDRRIFEGGVVQENTTLVNVSYSNKFFIDNPRSVDMSFSHTEIFVRENRLPEVVINAPEDLKRVNGIMTITGNASDADGNVTDIVLQIGDGSWQQATKTGINWSSWSFEWNTTSFAEGYYTINAKATDNEGAFSTVEIIAIVDNFPNSQPSVNISHPQEGEVINNTVIITGTASDIDGIIQVVQIKIDEGPWQGAVKSSSDWSAWSYTWDSTLYSEGNHVIKARAIDDEEANSTIDNITIVVNNLDNVQPTVNLVSHSGDEVVSGTVILRGESSDEDGTVEIVEIQIDDEAWQFTINTGLNYSMWDFEWDTTEYSNGEHVIKLRAIDDELATSRIYSVTLIVNNGGNMPPAVKITSHIDGEELTGSIVLRGISSDSDGFVELVQIQVDDDPWQDAKNAGVQWSLWNYSLDTTLYSNGQHIIRARSIDNQTTSSSIDTITISINNGGNMPPVVYITSHNDGEKVRGTVILKGISQDRDGFVHTVDIQIDDGPWLTATEIAHDWSAWNFNWETTLYPNGVHTVSARCTDNTSTNSAVHAIKITVDNNGNQPPVIEIRSHSDREIVKGMVFIQGVAFDLDGRIQSIEIQIGNGSWQIVGKTVSDWSKWYFGLDTREYQNGEHIITVKVTDNQTAWSTDTVILKIENEEVSGSQEDELSLPFPLPYWLLFLIIIAILIAIVILLVIVLRTTKGRTGKSEARRKKKKVPRKKAKESKTKKETPSEKKRKQAKKAAERAEQEPEKAPLTDESAEIEEVEEAISELEELIKE